MFVYCDQLSAHSLKMLRSTNHTLIRVGAKVTFIRNVNIIMGTVTSVEASTRFDDYFLCSNEDLITVHVKKHTLKMFDKTFYIQPPSIHRIANGVILELPKSRVNYDTNIGMYVHKYVSCPSVYIVKEFNRETGLYEIECFLSKRTSSGRGVVGKVEHAIVSITHFESIVCAYRRVTIDELNGDTKTMLLGHFMK